jgi:hypothetical protein
MINSVTPDHGKQGASVPIAIVGMNTHFSASSVVSISGGSISISGTSSSSATQVSATLAIDPNATASARTLTVTTGAEVVTSTFTVIASGQVQLSPPSLTFAAQNPYSTSASQPVVLTNNGHATLNISSIGASSEFGIASTTCGSTLVVSSSCNINVNFHPVHLATRTGSVTIVDDAPNSPQTVSVSGYGNFVLPLSRPGRPWRPIAVPTGGTSHIAISKLDTLGIAPADRVACSGPQGFRCSVKRIAMDQITLTVRTRNVDPGAYTLYLATPDRDSSPEIAVPVEVKDADSNAASDSDTHSRPSRPGR